MAKLLAPKALEQLRRRKQVREDRCEKRRARFETFVRIFPDSPVAKALAEQQYAGHDAHVCLSERFAASTAGVEFTMSSPNRTEFHWF